MACFHIYMLILTINTYTYVMELFRSFWGNGFIKTIDYSCNRHVSKVRRGKMGYHVELFTTRVLLGKIMFQK